MFKQFDKYTAEELRSCGTAFVQALKKAASWIKWDETEEWTEFVLDWFAATAPSGVLVDARAPRPCSRKIDARRTYGEFLVDLTHTTYPAYPPTGEWAYWKEQYWNAALKQPALVRLALESEWGKCGAPGATRVSVLQDAIKVAAMRATAKVMVFGPENAKRAAALFKDLERLRRQSEDPSPWLCVSLPWSDDVPSFQVFEQN